MVTKTFKISLDPQLVDQLRETVNNNVHISSSKFQTLRVNRKEKEYPIWDMVCAIMDRLDDTTEYLNHLELNTGKYRRSAFDFYDFMNQATVIIDCIDFLGRIYAVEFQDENKETSIFNQFGKDGSGTDKKYFEYLRSLCSVHPVETSFYTKTFQDNDFESSPFVVWNDGRIFCPDDGDLYAMVYINKPDCFGKQIKIEIEQIFKYVLFRYNLLTKIIDTIKKQNQYFIQNYTKTPLRTSSDFSTFVDYLAYLKEEKEKRLGCDCSDIFDFVIALLTLNLSNPNNLNHYKKYCNAFLYAISFEHKGIQSMNFEGYDNSGIAYPEANVTTTLFYSLFTVISKSQEAQQYSYEIQKIAYLYYKGRPDNTMWAYRMLNLAKPFFEKYITFSGAETDFEYFALTQIAMYFDCLNNKCVLNKNIPNDLKYRDRLLTAEEYTDLITPENEDNQDMQELLDLLDDMPSSIE